jgi:diguanylate cyclase (GGDEF)-like protein
MPETTSGGSGRMPAATPPVASAVAAALGPAVTTLPPARPAAPAAPAAPARPSRPVHTFAGAGFCLLTVTLCLVALGVPGMIRPGGWRAVVIGVVVVLVGLGVLALAFRELPPRFVLGELLVADVVIVLAAAAITDRDAGHVVAVMYVLPSLYAALFLPRWALAPQLTAVVVGTVVVMHIGQPAAAEAALLVALVLIATLSPTAAVAALRHRLLRALARARELSTTDPLTGLTNRRGLAERAPGLLRRALEDGLPVGVVVADVDHFKRVNDEHGHPVGDAVLRDVAYAMRSELRAFDLIYRLGGEEFAILLPGADLQKTQEIAERLRVAVARSSTGGVSVTMSFGAGAVSGSRVRLPQLYARADAALYRARRAGGHRVSAAVGV